MLGAHDERATRLSPHGVFVLEDLGRSALFCAELPRVSTFRRSRTCVAGCTRAANPCK